MSDADLMEQHQRCRYWPGCAVHTGVPVGALDRTAEHRGKLTDEQVADIRKRVRSGDKQIDVAADYGVGRAMVSMIVSGKKRRTR